MDTEYEKYRKDTRVSCKYGSKCYQKNPAHLEKYKHPPQKKVKNLQPPPRKKFKAEDKAIVKENASESEESSHQSDSDSGSESASITKYENQKANNDVSSSDNESIQSDANDVEESNGGPSDTLTLKNDESKESIKKSKSPDVKKTSNILTSEEQEWDINIKEKFLVNMPKDFYQFWRFCETLKPNNPYDSLKEVGLFLIGPFDELGGKFSGFTKAQSEYLIHWRYFRDPPEVQTVLRSDDSNGYHIGYFRDSPDELPVFLVSNYSKKNGILTQMGDNIFSAVNIFLEELKKCGNPFKKMAIGKIQSALMKEAQNLNIALSKKTQAMVVREKKIVARTLNKIGLVVPYDKKTEAGYRELALDNKALEILFTKLQNANTKEEKDTYLSSLQPVFTYASIATDECDFGTGIELGWDIISHGVDGLNGMVERFLSSNYKLLNKEAFAKIAEAHMKNRKQTLNLSIL